MQNHNKKDQMIEIISIIMGNFIIRYFENLVF